MMLRKEATEKKMTTLIDNVSTVSFNF